MHVVVDEREGRFVDIDIAQLAADGLPIEHRATALLDGKQRRLQVPPEMGEIDAGAIKVALVLEGFVRPPLDWRSAHRVEAHVGICLPADDPTVKATDDAARVAGLSPE